jgi:polyisoprenyl-phosphate glycosyltransferase
MHSDRSDAERSEAPVRSDIAYSVVLPVYGNEGTLAAAVERLARVAADLDGEFEAVFVVDGSPDGSLPLLHEILPSAPIRSQVVVHSRNFGAFPAIRAGLAASRGRFVGVMAADLQEPPELMEDFFRLLSSGEWDVAVGRRTSRQDPALSSLASRSFWWLYRRAINPAIPSGGVDVFACTRQVADELLALGESHSSLVGQLFWVGFRRAEVPYARAPRPAGESAWTLRKRVGYLLDSVFAFTQIPIAFLTAVGVVGALVTTAVALIVFIGWLTDRVSVAGYTPLMLVVLFSTFTILTGLGIVGSYVWRTFENSKQRPVSIVNDVRVYGD